jgi:hypothetical protein
MGGEIKRKKWGYTYKIRLAMLYWIIKCESQFW